jgi:hypothetical protein
MDIIFRPEKKYFQNGEKNGEILFFMEIIHSLWRKNIFHVENLLLMEKNLF